MRLFTLLSLAFTPFEMWMYGRLAGVTISTSPYAVFGIVGGLGKAACMSATLLTNLRLSGFYARHRTAIQTANFAAVWLMHIVCDLSHIGMASDKEPIYVQLAILKLVALCFHTQLPLVREQMWTDVVAYTLAMAIWTTILPNGLHHESVLYSLSAALLLVPISMRILVAWSEDRRRLASETHRAYTRAVASRSINHVSKRIMFNVAHGMEIIAGKLAAEGFGGVREDGVSVAGGQPEHQVYELLRGLGTEARTGLLMCENAFALVQIAAGNYVSRGVCTSAATLYAELNLTHRARVTTDADGAAAQSPVCVDSVVLRAILFNAAHNALQHGAQEAAIEVTTKVTSPSASEKQQQQHSSAPSLCIRIRNGAGDNHEKLLRLMGAGSNLISRAAIDKLQRNPEKVGGKASTFSGLADIVEYADAIGVQASLRVHSDHLLFELICPTAPLAAPSPDTKATPSPDIDIVEQAPAPEESPDTGQDLLSAREGPMNGQVGEQLPRGLVFVCVDDDEIPRLMAQSMLSRVAAHADSRVLGSDAAHVRSVPSLVQRLSAEHGALRVVVILDQNLDFDGIETPMLGTDLCRQLRARGFGGLIVIASANDDSESRDNFLRAGANRVVGKSLEEHANLPKHLAKALDELQSANKAADKGSLAADYWQSAQRVAPKRVDTGLTLQRRKGAPTGRVLR